MLNRTMKMMLCVVRDSRAWVSKADENVVLYNPSTVSHDNFFLPVWLLSLTHQINSKRQTVLNFPT